LVKHRISAVGSTDRRNYLGVRRVPIAEAQVTSFSVSFGENSRSEIQGFSRLTTLAIAVYDLRQLAKIT
jgi:hypothetical protein